MFNKSAASKSFNLPSIRFYFPFPHYVIEFKGLASWESQVPSLGFPGIGRPTSSKPRNFIQGLNTEQLITSQETDDEYDENYETILWPGIKISFVQNDPTGIVTNELECNSPYLIWTDEFFPQQDFLRVPYGIKCKVESETNQNSGVFKVKMLIPTESGAIVDESDGHGTDDADWNAEAEFSELDFGTSVTESEFKVYETDVFVTIESEYQSLDEMLR